MALTPMILHLGTRLFALIAGALRRPADPFLVLHRDRAIMIRHTPSHIRSAEGARHVL